MKKERVFNIIPLPNFLFSGSINLHQMPQQKTMARYSIGRYKQQKSSLSKQWYQSQVEVQEHTTI